MKRTGIRINTVEEFNESFREAIGPIDPTMEEEQISKLSILYFNKTLGRTIVEDEIIAA